MDPNNPNPQPPAPQKPPELASWDDIRAHPKMVGDYTEGERKVILDNESQWDEGEKFAFNELKTKFADDTAAPENAQPAAPSPDPAKPEEKKDPETPAAPTPFTFSSQAEMDAYIQKTIDAKEAEKTAAAQAAKDEEEKNKTPDKFFKEDWKPKDANELAKAMIENPIFAQALKNTLAPEIIKDYQEMNTQQRQALHDFNTEMDTQYTQLAKEHSLPDLKTPEGQEVNKKIATIALQFGKDNYLDAYDLYAMIPEEKGGGYKLPAAPEVPKPDPKAEQLKVQKAAAALVGGAPNAAGNPSPTKPGGPLDWKSLHNAKGSDLLAKRMSQ